MAKRKTKAQRRTARLRKKAETWSHRAAHLRAEARTLSSIRFAACEELDVTASEVSIEAAADDSRPDLKKFSLRAYNGGQLRVRRWSLPIVVDLEGMAALKRFSMLKQHDVNQIVGHTTDVVIHRVTAGRRSRKPGFIDLAGVLSGTGEAAREVRENAANDFPWYSSIGAAVDEVAYVDRGEKVIVNGRQFVGPIYVARKTRLVETSFVTAPGDEDGKEANVEASAFTDTHRQGGRSMNFEQWLEANGWADGFEDLPQERRDWLKAQFEAELEAADDDLDIEADGGKKSSKKPRKGDRSDSDDDGIEAGLDIEATGQQFRQQLLDQQAAAVEHSAMVNRHLGNHPELQASALREQWDERRCELEAQVADRPAMPGVSVPSDLASDGQVVEAALLLDAGMVEAEVAEHFGQTVMNKAVDGKMRGFGLHALMHETIRAAGMHSQAGMINDDFIETALRADQKLQAAGGAASSNISMGGILGNTANKFMLSAYKRPRVCWPKLAAVESNSNFQEHTRYTLGVDGEFHEVGPDGELESVGLKESEYKSQVKTRGLIITLTRQMMRNDDLGAFRRLVSLLGRKASLDIERSFWKKILDLLATMFTANNGNYFEGANSSLQISSLTTAVKLLELLESPDDVNEDGTGDPILVDPKYLVVPSSLRGNADELYVSTHVEGSSSRKGTRNIHANKYEPVSTPFLEKTTFHGSADPDHWFLWADPEDVAVAEVAFLDGRQAPHLNRADTNFKVLGTSWRAFHDFGVAGRDPRGAIRSKGKA